MIKSESKDKFNTSRNQSFSRHGSVESDSKRRSDYFDKNKSTRAKNDK